MSLLTLEDLAWLRQYRESLSGWSRYQLAKLRGASCGELMDIAGQVLVFDRDRYVLAQDLAASVLEGWGTVRSMSSGNTNARAQFIAQPHGFRQATARS